MRRRAWRWTIVVAAALAVGIGLYAWRGELAAQVASYQVASAASYRAAARRIGQFEAAPDRAEKIHALVDAWGRGDPRYDYYLARYIRSPDCGDELREAFSLEISWRPGLLSRWGHFWSWQSSADPAADRKHLRGYFDALSSVEPARRLTWRDVLDLQALCDRTGQGEVARRMKPDDWVAAYRRWIDAEPTWTPDLDRPAEPFPDWAGAVPSRPK
jgi:hypothetical protein